MIEPLDELDEDGNGITVPATYFVQIFNSKKTASLQRTYQQRQARPPVTFFALKASDEMPKPYKQQTDFSQILKTHGFTDKMKYQMEP